jgi:glutamine synthetase
MASDKKIIAEYIWIGGADELRSKARVISVSSSELLTIEKLPLWNYDGSSTDQASGTDSEVTIRPRRLCPCPFRKNNNVLVLCDTYDALNNPLKTNTRYVAEKIFNQKQEEKPWYGLEQEFFMINAKSRKPLGFNGENFLIPTQQGSFYCSVGADNTFGRDIIEDALSNMLHAQLTISGINAEVAPGQWEYQVGPVEGIDAADQLWLSRYILERTAEKYNIKIEYHPKPLGKHADWNGSGLHTNFSTQKMRDDDGFSAIIGAVKKLGEKHEEHMEIYGKYNEMRL